MTVRGIHHAGLVVDDLDRAIEFYGSLLAMEVVERDHWEAPAPLEDQAVGLRGSSADGVMLRGAGSYLELWQYQAPAQVGDDPASRGANERGWRHLAIEVDDVAAEWRRVGNILELMSTGTTMAGLDDLRAGA